MLPRTGNITCFSIMKKSLKLINSYVTLVISNDDGALKLDEVNDSLVFTI